MMVSVFNRFQNTLVSQTSSLDAFVKQGEFFKKEIFIVYIPWVAYLSSNTAN